MVYLLKYVILFSEFLRTIYIRCLDAVFYESFDLVFHERDERGDDNGEPVGHRRWQLIAERLSATRWHQYQRVLAIQHSLNNLLLHGAEGGEAEGVVEGLCYCFECHGFLGTRDW